MKCFSISLGCPKNRVDTERLLGSFDFEMTEEHFDADIIFINTCAFIAPAIDESIRTIIAIVDDIAESNTNSLLVIAGCLNGRFNPKEIAKEIPEVDLWLRPDDIDTWTEQLAHLLQISTPENGRIISTLPSYAWLKIGEGCAHKCSFCTIPSIRTKQQSYPKDFLLKEANEAVEQGVKEIILVAQDVTAWHDNIQSKEKNNLRPLLEGLIKIEDLKRIRLMYLYPSGISEDFLHFMANTSEKLLPYFDIPLQHAHEDILKQMGRPFAKNPYALIEKIRSIIPHAALRTSLIVGFPGEEEKHFESLSRFVEDVRFHNLGVFAYQQEEGTKAAEMPNQVDGKTKEWRRDSIMEIQADISEEILKNYFGKQEEILIDAHVDEWPGLFTGRTWFQAPEVDGLSYISGNNIQKGQLVSAEIVETKEYDLVALV